MEKNNSKGKAFNRLQILAAIVKVSSRFNYPTPSSRLLKSFASFLLAWKQATDEGSDGRQRYNHESLSQMNRLDTPRSILLSMSIVRHHAYKSDAVNPQKNSTSTRLHFHAALPRPFFGKKKEENYNRTEAFQNRKKRRRLY